MLMEEAAVDGSMLVEVRTASTRLYWFPHLLSCFRAAEGRVRRRHGVFYAKTLIALGWTGAATLKESEIQRTLEAASEGVAGLDFYADAVTTADDFRAIYRVAERAAEAGLGITCHAGEFSPVNLKAAVAIPGLTRLGHALRAPEVPGMLDELAKRQICVEVGMTSNLVLGLIDDYKSHPIRRFVEAGVPVTLATDDPLRFGVTLLGEYEIASKLGFSVPELLKFTENGIRASFTTTEEREAMLTALRQWSADAN
jgi:adenosine deaminase